MPIVASVDIDRPASRVWAYVADYGNDPSWRGGVTQMRPSQPDRPRKASPPTSCYGCWV
jgi:Polyketide cyclase / dehydrase and lipid transport